MERIIQVEGMRCGACADRVKSSLSRLPGVRAVNVELPLGSVKIDGTTFLTDEVIVEALSSAGGYRLKPQKSLAQISSCGTGCCGNH